MSEAQPEAIGIHQSVTMSEQQILCTRCGATFSKFLRDMEQHNDEVVCPHCGQLSTPQAGPPQPNSPRRE